MSSDIKPIGDKAFLSQFENLTLDPVHFNHLGHLRLAWLYLNRNNVDVAINLVCTGIKAYAESLGATQKFHLTMTDAIVRIMAKRIEGMREKSWLKFLQENTDLVEDSLSVLHQYYNKNLLSGEHSRTSLVQPDLKPI